MFSLTPFHERSPLSAAPVSTSDLPRYRTPDHICFSSTHSKRFLPPPEKDSDLKWKNQGNYDNMKGHSHEGIGVYGAADRIRVKADGDGRAGCGGVPEDGHQRSGLLQAKDEARQCGTAELRRLSHLETENVQVKRVVADLTLDTQMLQDPRKRQRRKETQDEEKTLDNNYGCSSNVVRYGHYAAPNVSDSTYGTGTVISRRMCRRG